MNKVEIERVNSYEITIDGEIHRGFIKRGEWEGFIKFQNKNSTIIVHKKEDSSFSSIFNDIFKEDKTDTPHEFDIVKLSPSLIPVKAKKPDEKKTAHDVNCPCILCRKPSKKIKSGSCMVCGEIHGPGLPCPELKVT